MTSTASSGIDRVGGGSASTSAPCPRPYVESRGTSVDAHPGNVFHHNTNVPPAT